MFDLEELAQWDEGLSALDTDTPEMDDDVSEDGADD